MSLTVENLLELRYEFTWNNVSIITVPEEKRPNTYTWSHDRTLRFKRCWHIEQEKSSCPYKSIGKESVKMSFGMNMAVVVVVVDEVVDEMLVGIMFVVEEEENSCRVKS